MRNSEPSFCDKYTGPDGLGGCRVARGWPGSEHNWSPLLTSHDKYLRGKGVGVEGRKLSQSGTGTVYRTKSSLGSYPNIDELLTCMPET